GDRHHRHGPAARPRPALRGRRLATGQVVEEHRRQAAADRRSEMMRTPTPAGPVYGLSYVRVSGAEHQQVGLSLDFQERTVREYIESKGWLLHAEYRDVESGAHDDRRGYQELLAEARRLHKAGKTAAVVVVRLDRFGRDLAEGARARKELRRL